jgi:hypothetical protein
LILPGAISISTWAWFLLSTMEGLRKVAMENRTETFVILFAAVLFMGLVCEDIGSHIESKLDDRRNAKDATHHTNWYSYLRIAFRLEPVGHHYLRTILLRLKFELGSSVAGGFALLGLWWLPMTFGVRAIASAFVIAAAGFLFWEASHSHRLLGQVRAEVLKGVVEVPAKLDTPVSPAESKTASTGGPSR